jgi:hypothetical protein
MFRREAGFIVLALFTATGIAHAASGSLTDKKGDYPDIVKLAYDNAQSKVVMTATYAGDGQNGRAQNESFYMRWGSSGQKYYQVFLSVPGNVKELRFSGSAKNVSCKGMVIKRPTARSTKVILPRSCISKAPDKLRFQAIATEGLYSKDETKTSAAIARG